MDDSYQQQNSPSEPLVVADAPLQCQQCGASLCLRQQVINLALGNVDEMSCLRCLAGENGQEPAQVLESLIPYVHQRDCFKKEWQRYLSISYCPDQQGCLPIICFNAQSKSPG